MLSQTLVGVGKFAHLEDIIRSTKWSTSIKILRGIDERM